MSNNTFKSHNDHAENAYRNHNPRRRNKTSLWVAIGAVILIILLLVWLTVADFTGNTDVVAFMSPYMLH
ncbi:MAG: hypothetical protein K2M79_05065 [Muribaculaceae bacterium]|nr:hypothetical protein [Muribaculaceae bacterium]